MHVASYIVSIRFPVNVLLVIGAFNLGAGGVRLYLVL